MVYFPGKVLSIILSYIDYSEKRKNTAIKKIITIWKKYLIKIEEIEKEEERKYHLEMQELYYQQREEEYIIEQAMQPWDDDDNYKPLD